MAIGDTWETINTYAFTDGTTIITAEFLNDAVNDLQFLYQRTDSKVNAWTANTNTGVNFSGTASNILIGLSVTFTPNTTSVMCLFHAGGQLNGWDGTQYIDFGYKVNSGAIAYFNQDTGEYTGATNMLAITGLTAGSSNTITFYAKTVSISARTMAGARVILWEMAN